MTGEQGFGGPRLFQHEKRPGYIMKQPVIIIIMTVTQSWEKYLGHLLTILYCRNKVLSLKHYFYYLELKEY